jgi:hypothetical protein
MLGALLPLIFSPAAPSVAVSAPAAPPAIHAPEDLEAELNRTDPERVRLARELIVKLDIGQVMNTMLGPMMDTVRPRDASLTAGQREEMNNIFASVKVGFGRLVPDMTDVMVLLYARNFTAQELTDIAAFYDTPSGKALVQRQGSVTAQSFPILMAIMPKVADYAEEDYCSRIACGEADHQIFAKMKERIGSKGK